MVKPIRFQIQTSLRGAALPLALSFSLLFLLLAYAVMDSTGIISGELNEIRSKQKCLREIKLLEDLIIDSVPSPDNIAGIHVFDDQDTIDVTMKNWGVFNVIGIRHRKFEFCSESFVLCEEHEKGRGYITGASDINLTGKIKLEGEINFRQKFRKARIEGLSFHGDISNATLNENISDQKEGVDEFSIPTNCISDERIAFRNSLVNDFNSKTRMIHSASEFDLVNCRLKGNIIVQSSKSINVDKNSKVENLILEAPDITITDNFIGSLQCKASRQISIGKNVRLLFPSSLYLSGENSKGISIGEGTRIDGMVALYNQGNKKEQNKPVLNLSAKSTIAGETICEGTVINEGSIEGTFIINSTAANIGSANYMNYMATGNYDASGKYYAVLVKAIPENSNHAHLTKRRIAKRL